jgi:predicted porin
MNKKLLAVAVAGALSAPVVALAQSSVTISGNIKMSVQQYKLGSPAAARAGLNTSQTLLHDDSSRIIFNMTEDLGGGLQAIAQIDWRVTPDVGADAIGGNNHVGLRSKSWGRIFFGRQDLHYFGRESDLTVKNDLQADSVSLLAYAGGGNSPVAAATRTHNVVHYTTPNWGGFTGIIAYSFNPNAMEADINSGVRKGYAWNLAPTFEARNWTIGYSYWQQRADGGAAAPNAPGAAAGNNSDQRGDRLFGSYRWGGFKIGLAWDKSRLRTTVGGATVDSSKRDAWSLPIEYTWGPHWIGGHYTKANNDKVTAVEDGAKMWAIGYNYSLSKRTSVGVTYAQIKNDTGAFYTPFTANSGLSGAGPHGALAGEDPRFWSMTIRHAF